MRRALLLLAIAAALPSARASAQESPARGLRIVVPDARGKAAYGKAPLTKQLRRSLTEAIGPLVPSKELVAAQKKLKLKGKKAATPEALTDAAKKTRAQYVLAIEITKEKWLFTARAVLINVENGQVQMDFRSQYFKPLTEAADRGKRIAARTVQKLEQLLSEGPAPFSGAGAVAAREPPTKDQDKLPEGDSDLKESPKSSPKEPRGAVASNQGTKEPRGAVASNQTAKEPAKESSPEPAKEPPRAIAPSDPGRSSGSSGSGSAGAGPSGGGTVGAKVEITPTRVEEESAEIIRFGINGGAGLLHTYDLSSSSVDNSRLSYRLQPIALVAGSVELVIPGVPLGIAARAAFRPVRFAITVDNPVPAGGDAGGQPAAMPKPNSPSGKFLDAAALVEGQFSVGGSGRNAVKLIPGLGLKVGILNVDQQPGNLIISANEVAVIGAFLFRFPINETLELDIGVDGGPIVSYKESPTNTGASGSGYTIGGDFQARIWLSSSIGITFDTRFDYDRVSFSGTPTRTMVTSEMLADVAAATKDLRTGVGIAFRL